MIRATAREDAVAALARELDYRIVTLDNGVGHVWRELEIRNPEIRFDAEHYLREQGEVLQVGDKLTIYVRDDEECDREWRIVAEVVELTGGVATFFCN